MKQIGLFLLIIFAAACGQGSRSTCVNQLVEIAGAKEKYALDRKLTNGTPVLPQEVVPFLKRGRLLSCPHGGTYVMGAIGEAPTCSIAEHRIPGR